MPEVVPWAVPLAAPWAVPQVLARHQNEGSFDFLFKMREDSAWRAPRLATEALIRSTSAQFGGRVLYVPVASYFEQASSAGPAGPYLRLVDPKLRTLVYKDAGHLSTDGTDRLEQLFRREVFGQRVC